MSGRLLFNMLVAVGAIVAVLVVAKPFGGGDDDDGGGGERAPAATGTQPSPSAEHSAREEEAAEPEPEEAPEPEPLPQNPDDVLGSEERSLTRAGNLRKALAILEQRRRKVEGVFDGLRVAPGRIDTQIKTPTKTTNIQVRPDFEISFESTHDFPNHQFPNFRKSGLRADDVDVTMLTKMLNAIDRDRGGDAPRDIDYFVVRRDNIDLDVGYGAYFRSGPKPRTVIREDDGSLRGF